MRDKLSSYVQEFKALVNFLLKDENKLKIGDYLLVKKQALTILLDKNAYETHTNKLKIWKALNWIKTDDNRLTSRFLDPMTKRQAPYIKIDLKVYEALKNLK